MDLQISLSAHDWLFYLATACLIATFYVTNKKEKKQ